MEISRKKLIIFSSRGGGPYKQHELLTKELKKKGYEVEHWSGIFSWLKLHFLIRKYLVVSNVPFLFVFKKDNYILNIHGNYNKEKNIFTNSLGYLYKINLDWARRITVPSEYLKKILKIKKALVIPNSIEKITLIKDRKKEKTIRLICVTHFAFKDKSVGVLEIIKSLFWLRSDKKIVLDIFGKGKFLDFVKKKSAGLIYPKNIKVNFRGYSKNILRKLNRSDIFVYWSKMDVMPTSLIEAMAAGLPIVANNLLQFRYFLPQNNYFCDSNKDFGKSIGKIVSDSIFRKKLGLENLKASKNFLIENNIKKWIKVIYGN